MNALWPRTTIATAAIRNILGGDDLMQASRSPEILADAAYAIFKKPAREFTGRFLIDDSFLAGEGVTDFERYRVDPSVPLAPDFFVPDGTPPPPPGVRVGGGAGYRAAVRRRSRPERPAYICLRALAPRGNGRCADASP